MKLKCKEGDVILIHEGYLGRIRYGKCIEEAYGYLGCRRNVMKELRKKCMGKSECQVEVNTFKRSHDCPWELRVHLYVRYSCERIILPPCEAPPCSIQELEEKDSGYLFHSPACPCPWILNVPQGRTISLKILDTSEFCTSITIHEESIVFDTKVCPLSNWKRIFTSLTNRLSFALTQNGFTKPILIHFSSCKFYLLH